jgi:hypothetical protein
VPEPLPLVEDSTMWFICALWIATNAIAGLIARRRDELDRPALEARALSIAFGCVVGILAVGHLTAVTIGALRGTLENGVRWHHYPLGIALATLGGCVAFTGDRRRLVGLYCTITAILTPLGPSALLAIPAVLAMIHLASTRRAVQFVMVATSLVVYAAFLAAALLLGDSF